jgi:hypothetical protein
MTDTQSAAVAIKPASTGAERVRRTRERKCKDIVFVGIEMSSIERDKLINFGLLNKVARNDKKALREAIHELFEKPWRGNGGKNG